MVRAIPSIVTILALAVAIAMPASAQGALYFTDVVRDDSTFEPGCTSSITEFDLSLALPEADGFMQPSFATATLACNNLSIWDADQGLDLSGPGRLIAHIGCEFLSAGWGARFVLFLNGEEIGSARDPPAASADPVAYTTPPEVCVGPDTVRVMDLELPTGDA